MNTHEDRLLQIKIITDKDPLLAKVFKVFEEIIFAVTPTDQAFLKALEILKKEIFLDLKENENLKKFLNLPAHHSSNFGSLFSRSLINIILLKTLGQLLELSGNNCFSLYIKEEILLENDFHLTGENGDPDKEIINALEYEIKLYIPRLNIGYQGNPKENGEIWFSCHYNYNHTP